MQKSIRHILKRVLNLPCGIRVILVMLASISCLSSQAQMYSPGSNMNFVQWAPFPSYDQIKNSSHVNQKWNVSTYSGVSAGVSFFNGGATFVSAPIGLQLNRQLNNNLVAFAGVSAGPSFFNINRSLADPSFNKFYPGSNFQNQYSFGINSAVYMGLMYVNDAKTFSISGSIGIQQSSYPVYPVQRINTKK